MHARLAIAHGKAERDAYWSPIVGVPRSLNPIVSVGHVDQIRMLLRCESIALISMPILVGTLSDASLLSYRRPAKVGFSLASLFSIAGIAGQLQPPARSLRHPA